MAHQVRLIRPEVNVGGGGGGHRSSYQLIA
jgi:hypothetical protein